MLGNLHECVVNIVVGASAEKSKVEGGVDIDEDDVDFVYVDLSGCEFRRRPSGWVGVRDPRIVDWLA